MANTQELARSEHMAVKHDGTNDICQPVTLGADVKLALLYHLLKWSLIPLKARSKEPVGAWKQYQKTPADSQTVLEWLKKGYGLGVVLGEVSDQSEVVIDLNPNYIKQEA